MLKIGGFSHFPLKIMTSFYSGGKYYLFRYFVVGGLFCTMDIWKNKISCPYYAFGIQIRIYESKNFLFSLHSFNNKKSPKILSFEKILNA